MPEEKKKPIGLGSVIGILLLAVSLDMAGLLFDIAYLIPIFGWIIGAMAGLLLQMIGFVIFSLWFYLKGVKFLGKIGPAAMIEFIPLVNALPAWTVATALTIMAANGSGILQTVATVFGRAKGSSPSNRKEKTTPPSSQQEVPKVPGEAQQEEPELPTQQRLVGAEVININDVGKKKSASLPTQARNPTSTEDLERAA